MNSAKMNGGQLIFLIMGVIAMTVVVTTSNIVVEIPINDWLTWGALTYPFAFLVTDLTNRALGAAKARLVVTVGFVAAVVMSLCFFSIGCGRPCGGKRRWSLPLSLLLWIP
jgi:uncharacterized PurR-regulated membrane protein YhhQ (DUF165 family)